MTLLDSLKFVLLLNDLLEGIKHRKNTELTNDNLKLRKLKIQEINTKIQMKT